VLRGRSGPMRVVGSWRNLAPLLLAIFVSGCGSAPGVASTSAVPTPGPSCACTPAPPTAPPGGISQAKAEEIALDLAPPSSINPIVVWAVSGSYAAANGRGLVPGGTWVWTVLVSGDFRAVACPTGSSPPVRPCGPAGSTQRIITGLLLGSFHRIHDRLSLSPFLEKRSGRSCPLLGSRGAAPHLHP
jgi:hypothetical protein